VKSDCYQCNHLHSKGLLLLRWFDGLSVAAAAGSRWVSLVPRWRWWRSSVGVTVLPVAAAAWAA